MNGVVWCAVGLVIGGLVAAMRRGDSVVYRIETVGVAVFGAFVGGDFLASTLGVGARAGSTAGSLGLAIAGATVMLVLLAVMRRTVGPLRPHKVRRRR